MTWAIRHYNEDDDFLAGQVLLDPAFEDRFLAIVGAKDRKEFYDGNLELTPQVAERISDLLSLGLDPGVRYYLEFFTGSPAKE